MNFNCLHPAGVFEHKSKAYYTTMAAMGSLAIVAYIGFAKMVAFDTDLPEYRTPMRSTVAEQVRHKTCWDKIFVNPAYADINGDSKVDFYEVNNAMRKMGARPRIGGAYPRPTLEELESAVRNYEKRDKEK